MILARRQPLAGILGPGFSPDAPLVNPWAQFYITGNTNQCNTTVLNAWRYIIYGFALQAHPDNNGWVINQANVGWIANTSGQAQTISVHYSASVRTVNPGHVTRVEILWRQGFTYWGGTPIIKFVASNEPITVGCSFMGVSGTGAFTYPVIRVTQTVGPLIVSDTSWEYVVQ